MFRSHVIRILCASLCLLALTCLGREVTQLKADEEMLFYPAMGWPADEGETWKIELKGYVYEPEQRPLAIASLRRALALKGISLSPGEEAILAERARCFMTDSERGKRVVVRMDGQDFAMGKTRSNGHFGRTVKLHTAQVDALGTNRLPVHPVLAPEQKRGFTGDVFLMHDGWATVLSDIDDTVKISMVTNSRTMLRKTFLEPFQPVPGMADLYRELARGRPMQFCYVSASPWQLFPALSDFLDDHGFPAGPFFLKDIRLRDRTVLNLFQDPGKYKPAVMERVFERLPNTPFILIGDSGERDPEIFAALAKKHPDRVRVILIRDAAGTAEMESRFRNLDLPRGVMFQAFQDPGEVNVESIWKALGPGQRTP